MRNYFLAVTLLAACSSGDSLGPSATPRLGRYAYAFEADGLTATGLMVLTYASPDSIAGHFEVDAYTSVMDLGQFNLDAYVVYGHPTSGGLAQQRLRLENGALICEAGQYFLSFEDRRPATCSAVYQTQ